MNFKTLLILPLLLLQAGCSSFGEGLARGLVNQESEDTRQCYVRGPSFDGIDQMIDTATGAGSGQDRDVKVLMVHGIGTHLPGYSTRIAENLARELELDVVDRTPKIIHLRLQINQQLYDALKARGKIRGAQGDPNGTVTVQRYRNQSGTRGLTFYELTWSGITEPDKQVMNPDTSGLYSFRRAGLNRELKEFINNHFPDPLIYLGDAHGNIQISVSQALCWMFTRDYEQVDQETDQICKFTDYDTDQARQDSFAFISHSMGSRILTDTLETLSASVAGDYDQVMNNQAVLDPDWADTLQNQNLTIFMLSNQLPLLQLGRSAPAVTGEYPAYCSVDGDKRAGRVFTESRIIAFSDPNDILSWSVPPGYEDQYLDSRICPILTNVIINIANVKKFLGIEHASVAEAHRNYDNDERIIKMIAHGLGDDHGDPLVKERCEWLQVPTNQ